MFNLECIVKIVFIKGKDFVNVVGLEEKKFK